MKTTLNKVNASKNDSCERKRDTCENKGVLDRQLRKITEIEVQLQ